MSSESISYHHQVNRGDAILKLSLNKMTLAEILSLHLMLYKHPNSEGSRLAAQQYKAESPLGKRRIDELLVKLVGISMDDLINKNLHHTTWRHLKQSEY